MESGSLRRKFNRGAATVTPKAKALESELFFAKDGLRAVLEAKQGKRAIYICYVLSGSALTGRSVSFAPMGTVATSDLALRYLQYDEVELTPIAASDAARNPSART